MWTGIGLCFLCCVAATLAEMTAQQALAKFYAKYSKDSFKGLTADAIETYIYGFEEFFAGNIASATARLNKIRAAIGDTTPYAFLWHTPPTVPEGFYGGRPVAYTGLRILQQVLEFANTKQITYAQSAAQKPHFKIVIAVAKCGKGKRALSLDLKQLETISVSIDSRLSKNNYEGLRTSLKPFQAYLWAITLGSFVADVEVREFPQCVGLSIKGSNGVYSSGALDGDRDGYLREHVFPQTTDADMVLFVHPSNRPSPSVFGPRVAVIKGGSLVGRRPVGILSDDLWFVDKFPLGTGEWTEVERRVYMPQWYQHEVFHYFFRKYSQFHLEPISHSWFNCSKWPKDFDKGKSAQCLEADYFYNAANKRLIPRLTPPGLGLALGLLTSTPTKDYIVSHWAGIKPNIKGSYMRTPATDKKHHLTITKTTTDSTTWVCKNGAGVSWVLTWNGKALVPSSTCPFGVNPAVLQLRRTSVGFFTNDVVSITFGTLTMEFTKQ